jgi:hypothetical protein
MRDPPSVRRAALDYKAALEDVAQAHKALASHLALLANDLEQYGQPKFTDMHQQACHQHRASSIKYRALAASLMLSESTIPNPATPHLPLTRVGMRRRSIPAVSSISS